MALHIIKLVVGVDSLEDFARRQTREIETFDGQDAVACWTRFQPKKAQEIIESGGSIYRVIKNRIVCRLPILGFDMVEVKGEGTFCKIMQSPQIIQTVSVPRKPFQGWRYLEPKDAPKDRGVYDSTNDAAIPPEMEAELRALGLI